ncbi:chemotaxis protein CheC [Caminicella sporogenes DSM 14501]|uniref:Chemotaxis protein CheC n=1 Tax=Caminicella sporogenes DSM 14501 TaxID=1121266 RepID=A0A1M6LA90_9FIRM|nr:chemotaxis protein CheC [Caminicella sporogenes]RKD27762.1 CheY-P-specific phosphatase CheC [Caminicella sporogenes]SHJ68110.1 chemotaxis protein CheC [Caminicella sporogenes DSM 14501]
MGGYFDNNIVIDILKEIGNIGAGNAATALAKMLNKRIDMNVPKVNVLDISDVPALIGGPETLVTGVYFKIEGDLDGSIMFVLDINSSQTLVKLLTSGYQNNKDNEIDDFTKSVLQEIGNILSGSYISSLSSLTGLNIKISIPSIAIDMAGAILSVPAIQFGQISDKILIIETEFIEGSDNVKGFFFLVPDYDSYDILLKSLGVSDYEGK